jgi:hypothetical protein
LDYDSPVGQYRTDEEFFFAELFERDTLRQGWGVPGLSITQDRDHSYILQYVFASWRYWNHDVLQDLDTHCRFASGRYNILQQMNRMNRDDVVLVPRTMRDGDHDRGFTVVSLTGDYRFEDRAGQPDRSWLKDYGHYRMIADAWSYEYSESIIPATDFQIYRTAIGHVASDHASYGRFNQVVKPYLREVNR